MKITRPRKGRVTRLCRRYPAGMSKHLLQEEESWLQTSHAFLIFNESNNRDFYA